MEGDGVLDTETDEDQFATHENIRDPIVNSAFGIFQSLEDFRNDH